MQRLLSLLLVCSSLFGAAGLASAADDLHQAPIGRVLVDLPMPPGFVEPSRSVPTLRTMGERKTPPSNRLLAMTKLAVQQPGGQVSEMPIGMTITTRDWLLRLAAAN